MNLNVQSQSPIWFARLGSHAEKDVFARAAGLFDGVALNANLVEGTPAACFGLLWRLGKITGISAPKPFVVDPMTYAFGLPDHLLRSDQIDRRTGGTESRPRRTFVGLAARYGAPFEHRAGRETLLPSHFRDSGVIESVTAAVLRYQMSRLEDQRSDDDDVVPRDAPPTFPVVAIPPYFCIANLGDDGWLPLNVRFAQAALKQSCPVPIYPVVCLDRSLLQDQTAMEAIAAQYQTLDCQGVFVWVSGLPEYEIGPFELKHLANLHASLAEGNRDVLGYFSGALGLALGFTGVVHGIGYGESRDVIPVLGGGPVRARFYFPPLRRFLPFRHARELVRHLTVEQYRDAVCRCDVCEELIVNSVAEDFHIYGEMETRGVPPDTYEIQITRSIEASRLHFATNRYRELDTIRTRGRAALLEELALAADRYRASLGSQAVRHLEVWCEGLSDGG